MANFYLYAIALTLVGITWLGWALGIHQRILGRTSDESQRNNRANDLNTQTNIDITRQRIDELEDELEQGLLSESEKQASINELKLNLAGEIGSNASDDPDAPTETFQAAHRVKSLGVGAVLLLLVLLVGSVYAYSNQILGLKRLDEAKSALPQLSDRVIINPAPDLTMLELEQFALAVRSDLSDRPDDATGWMLLGRVNMGLNRFEQAIESFERSLRISPNDESTQRAYLQALVSANDETSLLKADARVSGLLQTSPDDRDLLLMATLVSTQLGNFDQARRSYEQIRADLDPHSVLVQELQQRLGLSEQTTSSAMIAVDLTLADQAAELLAARRQQSSVVYVFARVAGQTAGPPAVVKRLPLDDFPITLTLRDADAMLPGFSLTTVDAVDITARVSFSGEPGESAGDLFGQASVVISDIQGQPVTLVIDKQVN